MNGRKWTIFPEELTHARTNLNTLQAATTYVFRVRVVTEDGESPYSPQSDEVTTLPSLALELLNFSERVKGQTSPSKYIIPVTEIADARNKQGKTRKMEIGKYMKII